MVRGLSLKELIQYAWGKVGVGTALHANLVFGGPAWFGRDRYDVTAKAPGPGIPSRDEADDQ
jgi:hypothetical protein